MEAVEYQMTIANAETIKMWRCSSGCSWRRIAELAAVAFPGWDIPSGNQIVGRDLCRQAAGMLNENCNDEPWN